MKFLNKIDGADKVVTDSSNRFVTDTEKSTWNGKQNALGYTPVNKAGDTISGQLVVESATFPVVDIARNTSGTGGGLYGGAKLQRKTTNPVNGVGIGFYFQAPNSDKAMTHAGMFGGALGTIDAGSEKGEIVLSPSYAGQDPYSRRDFIVRAISVSKVEAELNGKLRTEQTLASDPTNTVATKKYVDDNKTVEYTHPTSHPASMITGLPTSLPANGGDADTVDGFTVGVNVPANAKFTDTIYTHPTTAGNKHIPTGGTVGQVMLNSASGTAVWGDQLKIDNKTIVKNSNGEIAVRGYTPPPLYGVEIDESNSNPETSVSYTDDAVGFTPMRGNGGSFQWGSWETVFNNLEIKPCLLKNGVVNYYLNPDDYTLKAIGGASDITSGSDGDVMVEFPKLYWKMEKVGSIQKVQFSTEMFDGAKCPAHTVESIEKEKIYLSAYLGNYLSSKLRSLSGKAPTATQTIGEFRTQAQANGSGYQQATYYGLLMLQVLYTVFFKSIDSQTALGRGYVDGNSSAIATGATNKKGMFYGETTGKQQNKFCGIEDFWGNTYYWIDGFYSDADRNMMISKQDVFNDSGSGYTNHGVGASANTGGYINSVQGGTDTGFVIKRKTGSDSTYYSDYGRLNGGSLPRFGGHWYDGSSAGAFRLLVNGSASSSYASVGGRLCFIGG